MAMQVSAVALDQRTFEKTLLDSRRCRFVLVSMGDVERHARN